MDPKYYQVGPGFWGFVATFVMALAIIVIYRSLTKHLRKIRRDAEREREAQRKSASGTQDRDGGGGVVARETGDGQ